MYITRYIGRRLVVMVPQVVLIASAMFLLVRVIPADPAVLIAGPSATATAIANIRHSLGLDGSIFHQYVVFLRDLAVGDLGRSWVTGNAVTTDLGQRFPATFELLTYALLIAVAAGVGVGVATARRGRTIRHRVAERGSFVFGLLAGSMPEFWVGLMVVYVFFFKLGWLPAPLGRIDPDIPPPSSITGLYTVDSILTLNWRAFSSSALHLIGPVFTLAFVVTGPILK